MKLVSVTLTDNSAADIIGDALASVCDFVDWSIVIATRDESSPSMIRAISDNARDRYTLDHWSWRDDFSAARNAALLLAREHCEQLFPRETCYALVLDTDERIFEHGDNIRDIVEDEMLRGDIQGNPAGAFMMSHESGHYSKARIFRLPAVDQYVGPTHEVFPAHRHNPVTFRKAFFAELAKTPEQVQKKLWRDHAILAKHVLERPEDPRWHYYLGQTLHELGRHAAAVVSYGDCADLKGWPEEGAWACFKAGQCQENLKNLESAYAAYVRGVSIHPGMPENHWAAGHVSYQLGYFERAVHWSELAIARGEFQGLGHRFPRVGFKHPAAAWEAPFDTLAWALEKLGLKSDAENARSMFHIARTERTGQRVITGDKP